MTLLLLQFQCTKLRINLPEKLEMAAGIWPFQYEPVADINFGIDWRVQVTKKCHENSGGYALCLLYIVMSRLAFDFMAPGKLSAKTRPITRLQRLFPLPILP